MSGHNRGTYSKGKGQVDTILGCGAWTGRSMAFKKGPGNPAKKKKRKQWYEGTPNVGGPGTTTVSMKFSHKQSL